MLLADVARCGARIVAHHSPKTRYAHEAAAAAEVDYESREGAVHNSTVDVRQ